MSTPFELARERRRLEDTWYTPRGVIGWFMAVDHRTLGVRYIVTAFVFFTHRANIGRLQRGEEHRFGKKKATS